MLTITPSDSANDNIPGHIGQPRIEVYQSRSVRGIPSIDVTFANGVKDSLVLERFYPTGTTNYELNINIAISKKLWPHCVVTQLSSKKIAAPHQMLIFQYTDERIINLSRQIMYHSDSKR